MNPHTIGKMDVSSERSGKTDPFSLVAEDLDRVEALLKDELATEASLILEVSRYIFNSGGKRFRPSLHLLSARMLGLDDPIKYRIAAAIECLHTASLLHDDIVDGATLRRGKPAANVAWGDHIAVLVGDFLFTSSVKWILDSENMELTKRIARVSAGMAEGEAHQLKVARTRRLHEEDYLHVVSLKTAGLISLCCYSAAMLAETDTAGFEALKKFGHAVGMAFQIVDDALDYCSDTRELGKAIGKDLEEGKITLPMLHALDKAGPRDQQALEDILSSNPLTPEDLVRAQEIIQKHNGIDYALDRARSIIEDGKKSLLVFDECPARDALMRIADFTVSRSS